MIEYNDDLQKKPPILWSQLMGSPQPVCEQCKKKKKCCQQYHILHEDKIQIVKEILNSLPIDEKQEIIENNRTNSSSMEPLELSPTSSRANIGVSQISLPLAWKTKESRTFSLFLVLQTRTKVIDTKIITNIDKNVTDVIIPDSFIFDNEPENFCMEISIYAARTDYGLEANMGGSIKNRISRSLGRKFGASLKANNFNEKKLSKHEQPVNGAHYNLLAKATLSIKDASEEATIHNLRMSAFADLSGPPLYGHIICRMAIQPHSVLRPIAEGVISVHHINKDIELLNVFARLQGGHMYFYTIGDISNSSMETVLVVPLNQMSRVLATITPLTLLLKTEDYDGIPASNVYLQANSDKAYEIWRKALELQIHDIEIWGHFATTSTTLLYKKREDPMKETLSRAAGSNLYETISIKGSVSRNGFARLEEKSYSGSYSAATAPVKRSGKQRANVIDLFQSPKATRKEEEPSSYVIQLNIGEENNDSEYASYSPLFSSVKNSARLTPTRGDEHKEPKRSWSKAIGHIISKNALQMTRL